MNITIPTHNGEFTYSVIPLPASAPKLMPFQDLPFNGDTIAQAKVIELRDKYGITNAIETGTCLGSTTHFLAQVFRFVTTFENNLKFRDLAMRRLDGVDDITFVAKSSSYGIADEFDLEMGDMSPYERMFFFLDAHWEKSCPLQDELTQIAFMVNDEGLKPPVIMIHDWKVPDHPEFGFDSYNGQDFEWTWIKPGVDAIYGPDGYDIEFNSEATGAKRGILYITPRL